jgi:hypothetical protein
MQLTKRGEYALRTLIRLGVAHELGRELVSVSELAQAERLPLKFVEQILMQLRGAGLHRNPPRKVSVAISSQSPRRRFASRTSSG